MKLNTNKLVKLCNTVCAVIMLLIIILQFLPFWFRLDNVYMSATQYQEIQAEKLAAEKENLQIIQDAANNIEDSVEELKARAETEATEPEETEATEAATEATEPATEATEPATEATEPTTEATEPEETEPVLTNEELIDGISGSAGEIKDATQDIKTEASKNSADGLKIVSIAESVWFPDDVEPPLLNAHLLMLVFGAAGIFFCLRKSDNAVNCAFPILVICGGSTYWYEEMAQIGILSGVHGAMVALLVPFTLVFLGCYIRRVIGWFTGK